ncbi:MAG: energy transducer TonB [Candidatus Acidiferrales bacterium]
MKALASRMATSISHSKQKSVIVFDFAGPGDQFTALGKDLAEELRGALAQSGATFTVKDRAEIIDALHERHYALQTLLAPDFAVSLAQDLNADTAVVGKLSLNGANLDVLVEAYRTNRKKRISSLRYSLTLADDSRVLLAQNIGDNLRPDYPHFPAKGYKSASCLHCPNPQYTEQAVSKHIEGSVILEAVIGTNGRATEWLVTKWLPDGLTEKAIAAVQSWRFKPATGPDSKAAAVVMPIEVTFRLYK